MKVLLVEDNRGDARLIQEMLRRGGAQFELTHVRRLSQALQRLSEETFEVILLDLGLPDSQGIGTFDRIHAQAPDAPVVVLSSLADEALAVETVQHGAQDYLVKGQVDRNPLVRAIRYAVERKRTEGDLSNKNQLQDFLDNANDLIQSIAPDGRLLFVNRAWRETLGYTEEEVANLSLFDIIHPDSMGHCMEVFQRVMSGEAVNHVEAELVASDGSTVAVEGNVNCRFEDGKPVATRGIFRDITERKRMEEELRETADKLNILFESIADGIVVVDMNGTIIESNEAAVRIAGFSSKDEVLNKNGLDFIAGEDRERVANDMAKALFEGSPISISQYAINTADGGKIDCEVHTSMLHDTAGNPIGFIVVEHDITERKRMEEAIQQRNRELTTINAIAQLLSRPMRMNKMLKIALDRTLHVLDMSSGCIWLTDENARVLTLAAHKGLSSKFKRSSNRVMVGEGITGKVAETGEVMVAPDFLRNGRANHSPGAAAKFENLQSIGSIPLKVKGKTLGVMTVFEHGYRPFSPGDIQLLETIGGQIGIAIENAHLLEKLGELSVTDELTGLYNRRHFYEVLDAEAARTQRYGHPFSLVIIDLDGFKQYNDTFGHVSGDVALEDFANALRLTLRKTDVAFRHGGDEFAVILPSTDARKARKVIQRLRTRWEQVSEVRYRSLKTPLGFSAGIAQFPGDAETADGLLAIADITMYHAKELGKYRTEMASG